MRWPKPSSRKIWEIMGQIDIAKSENVAQITITKQIAG